MRRREWRVFAWFVPLALCLSFLGCWALDAACVAAQAPDKPPRVSVLHIVHHGSARLIEQEAGPINDLGGE